MTPRDLGRAVIGQCVYAPLVDERGGMINDPVLLKLAEDRYWVSISDSDVLLWAKGLALGMGLDVEIDDFSRFGGLGAQSAQVGGRRDQRWEERGRKLEPLEPRVGPGAPPQVEESAAGGLGGLGGDLAAELQRGPVRERQVAVGARPGVAALVLQPEEARARQDGHRPVPGQRVQGSAVLGCQPVIRDHSASACPSS